MGFWRFLHGSLSFGWGPWMENFIQDLRNAMGTSKIPHKTSHTTGMNNQPLHHANTTLSYVEILFGLHE